MNMSVYGFRQMYKLKRLYRVYRYVKIYGFLRTLTKVLGRTRPKFKFWLILKFPFYSTKGKRVGLVGCGQHAFSSIAYYLSISTNAKISFALDVDKKASSSLSYAFNAEDVENDYFPDKHYIAIPELIYISSNHASHADYAIQYLEYGCDIFIEKPIAINREQFDRLKQAIQNSNANIYTGYNRPHSESISIIKKNVFNAELPFTLSCFISGHFISDDHWYRDPSEGSRVVANLGHWIDLSVHVMFWSKTLPKHLDILISYSNFKTPSDNVVVSLSSSKHDLISMTFTSRSEPFEGVNETINFQQGDLTAKIDDFRSTKVWKGDSYEKHTHWPKNNGHKAAVLQPFGTVNKREWEEVQLSTELMLHIEGMVKSCETQSRFYF